MHRPSSGAINNTHRPSNGAINGDKPLPLSTQLQMQGLPDWALPWLRFRVFFDISASADWAPSNGSSGNGSSGNGSSNNGPLNKDSSSNGSSSNGSTSRGTTEHPVVPVCATQYYHDRLFEQVCANDQFEIRLSEFWIHYLTPHTHLSASVRLTLPFACCFYCCAFINGSCIRWGLTWTPSDRPPWPLPC